MRYLILGGAAFIAAVTASFCHGFIAAEVHRSQDGVKHAQKRKRPDSVRSLGTPVEQPSPEVCSQPLYVLIAKQGMARTGDSCAQSGY